MRDSFSWSSASVLNMLMVEWNWDDAIKVWQKEGREEGHAEGRQEMKKEMIELLKSGKTIDEIIKECEE